jgi:hypothetical protein
VNTWKVANETVLCDTRATLTQTGRRTVGTGAKSVVGNLLASPVDRVALLCVTGPLNLVPTRLLDEETVAVSSAKPEVACAGHFSTVCVFNTGVCAVSSREISTLGGTGG